MGEWLEEFLELDLSMGDLSFGHMVVRLAMATILGGLIGLERERLDRAAGLRTHALVSVGSALIMIVSTYGFPDPTGAAMAGLDPSRIAAQVVSGIGFLGAGVIIFRENSVRGLTTAATIWSVAGVGLAAGGGLYAAAIVGTAFMLIIQAGLKPIERKFFARHDRRHRVLMHIDGGTDTLSAVERALEGTSVRLQSLELDRASRASPEVLELTLLANSREDVLDVIAVLSRAPAVQRIAYGRRSSRLRRQERSADLDDDEDGA
jgi:putative Mg2+ transporter-C (MgtC) family protein